MQIQLNVDRNADNFFFFFFSFDLLPGNRSIVASIDEEKKKKITFISTYWCIMQKYDG